MDTTLIVAIVVAAVVVAAVAIGLFFLLRGRGSDTRELQQRFGPEYDRVVRQVGDKKRAEQLLSERMRRVDRYDLRPLSPRAFASLSEAWDGVQAQFVDDPFGAVAAADELVQRVMQERGYPPADFEQRAADVSVDHPEAVENYREGHAVFVRSREGDVSTDGLRQGFLHYRELFGELLETEDGGGVGRPMGRAHRVRPA